MRLSNLMKTTGRARILALLITLLMTFSVVACGDDSDSNDNNNTNADTTSEADTTSDPDTDDTPDSDDDTPDSDDGDPDTDDTPDTDNNDPDTTTNPDAVVDPDGLSDEGDSCEEIIDCTNECPDSFCEDECIDDGSELGLAQREALLTCISSNCSGISDQEDFATCINTNCREVYDACIPPQPAVCLQDCEGEQDTSCPNGTVCTDLGVTVCLNEDGSTPEDAQDCTNTSACDNPAESCYILSGGGSGQTDCTSFPDTTDVCLDESENCYQVDEEGNTQCYPYDDTASAGDACEAPNECNDKQACLSTSANDGACFDLCDTSLSDADNRCGEGSTCQALTGSSTPNLGYCAQPTPVDPDAEVGDDCSGADAYCAADQYCITFGDPNDPNSETTSTCEQACDTDDGSACGADAACGAVPGLESQEMDGICQEVQVDPDAEVGDDCDQDNPCAADQLCVGPQGGPTTCELACDTTATTSVCVAPQTCQPLQGGGDTGICGEAP